MSNENAQLNDLVNNNRFIRWVKEPDDDTRSYWEGWLQANPDKREMLEEGRQIVSFLHFKTPAPSAQEFWEVRQRIKAQIREDELQDLVETESTPPAPAEEQAEPFSRYYQMAAVWVGILLVALGTFLYFQTQHTVSYQTGYGQIRTIWLPDQSQVILNANSSIKFYRNWSAKDLREVWLKGEAFFEVRKSGDATGGNPLVVHANLVQVQVQGTQFNLHNRRGKVRVVLNEGQVQLKLQGVNSQPVLLRPGDLAEVLPDQQTVHRKQVKPGLYSTWRNHQLVFEETPLREVAQTLEDYYGVDVKIQTAALAGRRFTGSVPTRDLQVLLAVLSESFGIRITHQAQQINMEGKN
jgi:ferric-dicitrate binding protein FerR (iron transport regulator)